MRKLPPPRRAPSRMHLAPTRRNTPIMDKAAADEAMASFLERQGRSPGFVRRKVAACRSVLQSIVAAASNDEPARPIYKEPWSPR